MNKESREVSIYLKKRWAGKQDKLHSNYSTLKPCSMRFSILLKYAKHIIWKRQSGWDVVLKPGYTFYPQWCLSWCAAANFPFTNVPLSDLIQYAVIVFAAEQALSSLIQKMGLYFSNITWKFIWIWPQKKQFLKMFLSLCSNFIDRTMPDFNAVLLILVNIHEIVKSLNLKIWSVFILSRGYFWGVL